MNTLFAKLVLSAAVFSAAALVGCDNQPASPTVGDTTPGTTNSPDTNTRDRDNTGVNTRDRDSATQTAGQAGQGKSDVDIAAEIRRKVTDTQMSINAQNSKIVVNGGKVVLRGPVKTQEEKDTIARMATEVVGAANVDNQLEVEANK